MTDSGETKAEEQEELHIASVTPSVSILYDSVENDRRRTELRRDAIVTINRNDVGGDRRCCDRDRIEQSGGEDVRSDA